MTTIPGLLPLHLETGLADSALLRVAHGTTDALIGLSYFVISGLLATLVHRGRAVIAFHGVFLAFGTFIVACGLGHLLHVLVLWRPSLSWRRSCGARSPAARWRSTTSRSST